MSFAATSNATAVANGDNHRCTDSQSEIWVHEPSHSCHQRFDLDQVLESLKVRHVMCLQTPHPMRDHGRDDVGIMHVFARHGKVADQFEQRAHGVTGFRKKPTGCLNAGDIVQRIRNRRNGAVRMRPRQHDQTFAQDLRADADRCSSRQHLLDSATSRLMPRRVGIDGMHEDIGIDKNRVSARRRHRCPRVGMCKPLAMRPTSSP